MKHDLTGLSDEARVVAVERYILARLKSRHHGKAEAIGAVDLVNHFKLRDLPAMHQQVKGADGRVTRGHRLTPHNAKVAYMGELLREAAQSLKARAITQQITTEMVTPKAAEVAP